MTAAIKDIFICHASEDKEKVAYPLFRAFEDSHISCWYDEAEIRWGDSITEKVNYGMQVSTYVMVVLSPAFLQTSWPQREMYAALNVEASSGNVKVLPLIVGTNRERKTIIEQYPLLNDKYHLFWDGHVKPIVQALQARLNREQDPSERPTTRSAQRKTNRPIPMPKINREFTQFEKDTFLREAFSSVEGYFRTALADLKQGTRDVETDLNEIDKHKFICTVYIKGKIAIRCKIWLGGLTSSNSIAYYEGESYSDSDNSMNDWLTVKDDGQQLGFETSGMWFKADYSGRNFLTVEEASEYLWRRFTERLTRR